MAPTKPLVKATQDTANTSAPKTPAEDVASKGPEEITNNETGDTALEIHGLKTSLQRQINDLDSLALGSRRDQQALEEALRRVAGHREEVKMMSGKAQGTLRQAGRLEASLGLTTSTMGPSAWYFGDWSAPTPNVGNSSNTTDGTNAQIDDAGIQGEG